MPEHGSRPALYPLHPRSSSPAHELVLGGVGVDKLPQGHEAPAMHWLLGSGGQQAQGKQGACAGSTGSLLCFTVATVSLHDIPACSHQLAGEIRQGLIRCAALWPQALCSQRSRTRCTWSRMTRVPQLVVSASSPQASTPLRSRLSQVAQTLGSVLGEHASFSKTSLTILFCVAARGLPARSREGHPGSSLVPVESSVVATD